MKDGLQLYDILNKFDAMISDYSSITFDYLHLNRPIGYTLDDFDEYEKSRGFAYENPKDYMPGHHIYNFDDFLNFIKDVADKKDEFEAERKRVQKEVGLVEGWNNCQRILEWFHLS